MTYELLAKTFAASSATTAGTGVVLAMTDPVAISIVTSLSAVVMAAVSAYFSYKAKTISETTGKAVDGRLTEFKTMAKQSFTAEGVLQEKTAEHLRQVDAVAAKAEGVAQEQEKAKSGQIT